MVSEPGSAIDVITADSNEGVLKSEVNNTAGNESGVTETGHTTQDGSVPKSTDGEKRACSQKSDNCDETTGDTVFAEDNGSICETKVRKRGHTTQSASTEHSHDSSQKSGDSDAMYDNNDDETTGNTQLHTRVSM